MTGIYVLFSGGYDSAYCIRKILKEINNKTELYELNLISIEPTFTPGKIDREIKARESILKYWKNKYNAVINHSIIKIDTDKFGLGSVVRCGLPQPLFWVFPLISSLNFNKYDQIQIVMSYISGDDATTIRDSIDNIIYESLNILDLSKFAYSIITDRESLKDRLKISYPLLLVKKEKIILDLLYYDKFLLENCTTCESMREDDFCGTCKPCENLKNTLILLKNRYTFSESNLKVLDQLLSRFNKTELGKLVDDDWYKEEERKDVPPYNYPPYDSKTSRTLK